MRITTMLCLTMFSVMAHANLVTNPGFEDGATGWMFSDGDPSDGRDVGTCASPCVFPHTGDWAGFKNLFDGGSGTISQSITTTVGTTYVVNVWLADNSFESGTVFATFGDTIGVTATGSDTSTTYTQYMFSHITTEATTDFVFGGTVTGGTFFIDDVSIQAIPLPGALALFAPALLILCAARKKYFRHFFRKSISAA